MRSEFQDFLDSLEQKLGKLSIRNQIVFAAACCERHFYDYIRFVEQDGRGDISTLREVIDLGWAASSAEVVCDDELVVRCRNAIPDSDEYGSPAADYGQSAAIMVTHFAKFLSSKEPEEVFWIVSAARDLMDAKVQIAENVLPSDPAFESKIQSSPLMRNELRTQQYFLSLVLSPEINVDQIRGESVLAGVATLH